MNESAYMGVAGAVDAVSAAARFVEQVLVEVAPIRQMITIAR
jgi:hypothetical protein